MRTRYAFTVLALLSLMVGAACILFTVHYVARSNRQFCSLLVPAVTPRIARPASPAAHPVQEQQWEWQQRYLGLSRSFGC